MGMVITVERMQRWYYRRGTEKKIVGGKVW
jgi:hypothetical protein